MKGLGRKDLKILWALENDSGARLSEIAEIAGLSKESVSYKVDALIGKGIIRKFYTVVDYSVLGHTAFKVLFRLYSATEEKQHAILRHLRAIPNIGFISSVSGKWDLNVDIFAENLAGFDETLSRIVEKFPDQLSHYSLLIKLDALHFTRGYLCRAIGKEKNFIEGAPRRAKEIVEIDDVDVGLLKAVSGNARATLVELSAKTGLSPNGAKNRLENLREKSVIIGRKVMLDPGKIGRNPFIILLKFNKVNREIEEMVKRFCKKLDSAVYYIRLVGDYDFHIEVEAGSSAELRQIILGARNAFGENLREIDTLTVLEDHKIDFFPISQPADSQLVISKSGKLPQPREKKLSGKDLGNRAARGSSLSARQGPPR